MPEDTKTKDKADDKPKTDSKPSEKKGASRSGKKQKKRQRRSGGGRRDDFEAEIIDVRRVTRVVAGGRRFSFRVAAVAGDHKGKVGVGLGKANDISDAIGKAINNAKKNSIKIDLTDDNTIPYPISAKFNASVVDMHPAPGRGLVSGSSVRDVVRLAGIKDVSTKLISRSKNKLNNARAAIAALKKIEAKEE
ncbi:MAG: 30S ribosomal protein S5 [Candidatus Paceibacterota bacterium]